MYVLLKVYLRIHDNQMDTSWHYTGIKNNLTFFEVIEQKKTSTAFYYFLISDDKTDFRCAVQDQRQMHEDCGLKNGEKTAI